MKNVRMYAAWIYLFLILVIAACGGYEGIVNSNSADNKATSTNQEPADDTKDDVHHFDAPTDGGGGN